MIAITPTAEMLAPCREQFLRQLAAIAVTVFDENFPLLGVPKMCRRARASRSGRGNRAGGCDGVRAIPHSSRKCQGFSHPRIRGLGHGANGGVQSGAVANTSPDANAFVYRAFANNPCERDPATRGGYFRKGPRRYSEESNRFRILPIHSRLAAVISSRTTRCHSAQARNVLPRPPRS